METARLVRCRNPGAKTPAHAERVSSSNANAVRQEAHERRLRLQVKTLPPFVLSRKVMVLANLLKRGAGHRYRRLLGLPQGEWGVIAQLGERAPRTLGDLAAGMGLDITQISRSVSNLVARGLVTRVSNPLNNREVLIALSRQGEMASAVIAEAGLRVNNILLEGTTAAERSVLASQLENLTRLADRLLLEEQAFNPEQAKAKETTPSEPRNGIRPRKSR